MPKGVKVPDALRETVYRMSDCFTPQEIRVFTDVSERQQQRILHNWRQTGTTAAPPVTSHASQGRPRTLSAQEAFVSLSAANPPYYTDISLHSSFITV
jgi:hypothetical protein